VKNKNYYHKFLSMLIYKGGFIFLSKTFYMQNGYTELHFQMKNIYTSDYFTGQYFVFYFLCSIFISLSAHLLYHLKLYNTFSTLQCRDFISFYDTYIHIWDNDLLGVIKFV